MITCAQSAKGEGCEISGRYTPVPPSPSRREIVTEGTFVKNISADQVNLPLGSRCYLYWVSGNLWYILYALLPIYRRIFVYNISDINISDTVSGGASKTVLHSMITSPMQF